MCTNDLIIFVSFACYEHNIVYYKQEYQYSLGGTNFAVQGAFQGLPRRFNTMQTSPNWAVQKGRIISIEPNPSAASPLPGSFAMDPIRSTITAETPQVIGKLRQVFYPISWYYRFRDPNPMPGIPASTP